MDKTPYYSTLLANSKVSGIHVALTHLKTVLFIDRTDSLNSQIRLPTKANEWAYAAEFNLETHTVRGLNVITDTFCSTGQMLPDGTFASIGGSSKGHGSPLANGASSVRLFRPCTDGTCDFSLAAVTTVRRWYSASQILPDGRIIVLGGVNANGNILINSQPVNVPTYEFYPRKANEGSYFLDILNSTVPFNLYPLTHLLPSGRLFLFVARFSVLLDYVNNVVAATLPEYGPPGVYRNYPVTGTSFMLPLTPANRYTAEIVVCGGNYGTAYNHPSVVATNDCGRIAPESPTPAWESDKMPFVWFMPDAVQLVDGTTVILNGAQKGFMQLNQSTASSPNLTPVVYDYRQPLGSRWSIVPGKTKTARMYHSSAILLPDTRVLISGSNPNPKLTRTGPFPTQFLVEAFAPRYLHTGALRPSVQQVPAGITYEVPFVISGLASGTTPASGFQAVLINPGFSTHCQRYGQRYIELAVQSLQRENGTFTAQVLGPPSNTVAPPGYYWLHFLDNGIPNVEGSAVQLL